MKHLGYEYVNPKLGNPQRFGLFSQPPPNAIGETNMYPKTIPEKDEAGKPVTAERNFYTGCLLKGKVEGHRMGGKSVSTFFEKGKFNLDKYVEPKPHGGKLTFLGDFQFKPVAVVGHAKTKSGAAYEYEPGNKIQGAPVPDGPELRKKYRDEEGGHVIIKPPQMLTGPHFKPTGMKQWNKTFQAGPTPHMADDYNYAQKQRKKELEYHHSKMQDAPFYNVGRHPIKRANLLNCRFGSINSAKEILYDPSEEDKDFKKPRPAPEPRFAPS